MPAARPSYEKVIFELSSPGRFAYSLPACDVPESDPGALLPPAYLRETPPPETRVEIITSATDEPTSFALSPDGRQIVFVASG